MCNFMICNCQRRLMFLVIGTQVQDLNKINIPSAGSRCGHRFGCNDELLRMAVYIEPVAPNIANECYGSGGAD